MEEDDSPEESHPEAHPEESGGPPSKRIKVSELPQ